MIAILHLRAPNHILTEERRILDALKRGEEEDEKVPSQDKYNATRLTQNRRDLSREDRHFEDILEEAERNNIRVLL